MERNNLVILLIHWWSHIKILGLLKFIYRDNAISVKILVHFIFRIDKLVNSQGIINELEETEYFS